MSALGNRHECIKCEVKFYDLGRTEVICPSCGANQADEAEEESEEAPATARAGKARKP